jgi:hypothetical protein
MGFILIVFHDQLSLNVHRLNYSNLDEMGTPLCYLGVYFIFANLNF